ncbi:GNAT family N-acetyltransferase [Ponticaulis sp.]|uniref:GNAT family N-acetyltransferase n=1 Tax=Ponticaulis sp. TaxID=2020902 RepID=UPI000B62C650|nr:GNAT family N-acetyltransferase [Ponticaulis sp.]MAI90866.1 GNAT family N-acetyltransferase [Ponticaulis sp.]OUX98840.1 MAG: hypothetical protein CBB65_10515 [Hyphomonadaceae bacterium TMED5]|tara:strand:+ start:30152 stop:30640 length:489 start_codon:yes stop_codon:yes gene_type:complete
METRIRPAIFDDLAGVPDLFEVSIRQIASQFYSQAQINAWISSRANLKERLAAGFSDRAAWVAIDARDRLLAYIDLEPDGHIDFFYAHPDVSRTDTTLRIYKAAEAEARDRGMSRLYSEASEAALRFFEKHGFTCLERRELLVQDTSIHNYQVEKKLFPPGQ